MLFEGNCPLEECEHRHHCSAKVSRTHLANVFDALDVAHRAHSVSLYQHVAVGEEFQRLQGGSVRAQ